MTAAVLPALVPGLDFDETDTGRLAARLRALRLAPEQLPALLEQAFERSDEAGRRLARAVASSAGSSAQFIAEGRALFAAVATAPPARRQRVLGGLLEAAGPASALLMVHGIANLAPATARAALRDYLQAGGTVDAVSHWLQLAGQATRRRRRVQRLGLAGDVVDTAGDVAAWVLGAIEDGVEAVIIGIDALLEAAVDAGLTLVQVFEAAVGWTVDRMVDLLLALNQFGAQLLDYVSATFDWAYSAVRNFVRAALQAGFDAAALLEQAVGQSYFVLRRFVDGLFNALGDVGAVMDAALGLVEQGATDLWRGTLLALRYAGADLIGVLDWMARQTQAVFTALMAAWEDIGESLVRLFAWALEAGHLAWQMIGQATQDIANSVWYVYNFLVTSGPQYLFDYTRGLLQAHLAPAGLIAWAIDQAFEVLVAILRAALEAGITVAEAMLAIIDAPRGALQTLVQAMLQLGQTLEDLLRAVFVDTAQAFLSELVDALLALGQGVFAILTATLNLGGAFLGAMFSQLCNRIGTYRGMTTAERADAAQVFGNSLDCDLIFLSLEDPANEILFGLQDFFRRRPDSRAFATSNLINFDVDDGQIDRATLIHELTHVWQNRQFGGIYMARAIAAQIGPGYNYGYHEAPEALGTADGLRTRFTGTLRLPVTPGSVAVFQTAATAVRAAVDDGAGQLLSTVDQAVLGRVDYDSGALDLSFVVPPAAGDVVEVYREVDIDLGRLGSSTPDLGEGFFTGTGGEAALRAADGDLDAFNVEQQAQIIMHGFVRRHCAVTRRDGTPIVYDSGPFDAYLRRVAGA